MDFSTWVIVVVVASVAMVIGTVAQTRAKKSSLAAALGALGDFKASQHVMGADGMTGLAIDEGRSSVCLMRTGDQKQMESFAIQKETYNIETRIVGYRDILSCELFEDGTAVTKTSRSSQAAGAAVGGVLLGGVGLLIGGLSGSTRTQEKISHVALRLIVNDTTNPTHDVNFLVGSGGMQFAKNSLVYKAASENARRWYSLVRVLIERADREAPGPPVKSVSSGPTFVADELAKLSALRKEGALTDEEFAAQKSKLLQ